MMVFVCVCMAFEASIEGGKRGLLREREGGFEGKESCFKRHIGPNRVACGLNIGVRV